MENGRRKEASPRERVTLGIVAFLAYLVIAMMVFTGCVGSVGLDETPHSIPVLRYLCCGEDGRSTVLGHDPVAY